jgi:hypothetical protein
MQFERLAAAGQNVHHPETRWRRVLSKRRELLIQRRIATFQQPGMTGYTPAEVFKTSTQFFLIALTSFSL